MQEIEILNSMNHPNIMKFYGIWYTRDSENKIISKDEEIIPSNNFKLNYHYKIIDIKHSNIKFITNHGNFFINDVRNFATINFSNSISDLSKKLNYLNIFYKNLEIVHYQDKLNKNVLPENFDYRIKKVIENPFEMYKYLRKEKDFIRWTKFISDKVIQMYHIPISLSSEDFSLIELIDPLLVFNIAYASAPEPSPDIVIVGDHLTMKSSVSKALEHFSDRSIFNLFISRDHDEIPNREVINHFDLYPSILTQLNFYLKDGKAGLGCSGFDKVNCSSITSVEQINDKLHKHSSFWLHRRTR